MRNKCRDIRRADASHSRIVGEIRQREGRMMEHYTAAIDALALSDVNYREIMRIYQERLSGFPAQTQEIFTKSRHEGMSRSEIAADMGISENRVKYKISKVLADLREALKNYGDLAPVLLLFMSGMNF